MSTTETYLVTLVTIEYATSSTDKILAVSSFYRVLLIERQNYIGVGEALKVRVAADFAEISSRGCQISVQLRSPEMLRLAQVANVQGRAVKVKLLVLDPASSTINLPIPIYAGRADRVSFSVGKICELSLAVETQFIQSNKRRREISNDLVHRQRFPNDLFYSHMEQIERVDLGWGRP